MRGGLHREQMELAGLRAAAVFEALKGLIVLAVGFGLLALIDKDVEEAAESLVEHLRLNPTNHYPHIFLQAAGRVTDTNLIWLAAGAFGYSSIRLFEAFGLWHNRRWAEWLGVLSGALFLPLEIYELTHGVTTLRVVVLTVNLAVVLCLAYVLRHPLHSRVKA